VTTLGNLTMLSIERHGLKIKNGNGKLARSATSGEI